MLIFMQSRREFPADRQLAVLPQRGPHGSPPSCAILEVYRLSLDVYQSVYGEAKTTSNVSATSHRQVDSPIKVAKPRFDRDLLGP